MLTTLPPPDTVLRAEDQMIADGFAVAQYVSLDGYQTQSRQADHQSLDAYSGGRLKARRLAK